MSEQTTKAETIFVLDAALLGVLFGLVFLNIQPPYPVSTIIFVGLLIPAFGGLFGGGSVPRSLWFLLLAVAFIALFVAGGAL